MQILLVEDDFSYAETLVSVINSKFKSIFWSIADNSTSAIDLIKENFYDLVILDLCMPKIPSGIEKNVENGQGLFYSILDLMPGTPIYILTGSNPDRFATDLSRHGERVGLWGSERTFPTILYFTKNRTPELIKELAVIHQEIFLVDSISINTRGKEVFFALGQQRALKTFVRRMGGADGVYHPLNGLSGSLVGRILVRDTQLNPLGAFVAKLGKYSKIQKENESYERHVRLMPINTFTPLIFGIDKGLKEYGAIFYSLAEGFKETLFEVMLRDPLSAVGAAQQVRNSLERWSDISVVSRVTIGDIRRTKISDNDFNDLVGTYGLELLFEIENIVLSASYSCVHGDLHGGNILVSDAGVPVLIDFGDVGPGYTGIDPITLEMSLIFHPDCVASGISHQMQPFLEHWPNVDNYIKNNPYSAFVKFCRDWAYDVGGDDRSVLASGYAFAIRQLKYTTVSSDETIRLILRIADSLKLIGR